MTGIGYLQLLRENRNFTLLWTAQVVSLTGDWFNTIVLSALVAEYSDGSGLAISLFLMSRFLPPLLVSPFAGVIVDRFNRQHILVYSNLLRTGVVLMFLITTTSSSFLWLIYLLTVVQFTLSALFEPGQSAIIPSLIKRENLVVANTLVSITWSVMLALGAILGGVVAAIFGSATALIVGAVTFAVAALLIALIRLSPEAQAYLDRKSTEGSPDKDTGSFREGLRYLAANKMTSALLLVKGAGSIGNVDTLMTVMATQIFIMGTDGQLSLGIMYSAFGVGAFVGPLLMNRINDGSVYRMRRLVIVGFVLAMLGWFVLGVAAALWVVSVALLIRAMGGSINWTYSTVMIQKRVDDRFLGRVFALDMAIFQLATVVSTLVHGALVDMVGHEQISLIAYGTGLVSLIPLILWAGIVPRMERREIPVTVVQ